MQIDLQIVMVGQPPLTVQMHSHQADKLCKSLMTGNWVEVEIAKGVKTRINPATVVMINRRAAEFKEDGAPKQPGIIMPN